MQTNAAIYLVLALACSATPAICQVEPASPTSTTSDDNHTIGSASEKWQKVESNGQILYVETNGQYFTKGNYVAYGFHTRMVSNLPESDIVGAPQSVMIDVEGNCDANTFHVDGSVYFAGKNRSGTAMSQGPAEDVERKITPNSQMERAFVLLCKFAHGQAPSDGDATTSNVVPAHQVNGLSPRLCAAVDYSNPKYVENMEALAKRANLPDSYYNRYEEDFVKALCKGDQKFADQLIDDGDVLWEHASQIKQALMEGGSPHAHTAAPPRSDSGRSYGFSKQKFIGMGLCMACADNVAQWYSQKPTSSCGKLAKHALEGDPAATKELQTFPSYCTWDYK